MIGNGRSVVGNRVSNVGGWSAVVRSVVGNRVGNYRSVVDWGMVDGRSMVDDRSGFNDWGWSTTGGFLHLGLETSDWVGDVVYGTGAAVGFDEGVRSLDGVSLTGFGLRFGVASLWVSYVVFEAVVWVTFVLLLLLLLLSLD